MRVSECDTGTSGWLYSYWLYICKEYVSNPTLRKQCDWLAVIYNDVAIKEQLHAINVVSN